MGAEVTAIAAVAENGVIGDSGGLPWDGYGADLEFFREETMGHPVILGRVTYESIVDRNGGPLEGRTNIVVSGSEHFKDEWTRTVGSPGSAITLALRIEDRTYVAGGASIYRTLMPISTRLLITEIPESPDGDVEFPEIDGNRWREASRDGGPDGLEFVEYERRDSFYD